MALLSVDHTTRYAYAASVDLAQHLAYLRPIDDGAVQQVEVFDLAIDPPPSHQRAETDAFDNRRLAFTLAVPHRELNVHASARVRVAAPAPLEVMASAPWETVRERLRFAAGAPFEPAAEFAVPSPYVPRLAQLREWAAPSFTPGRPVAAAAIDLMGRLHRDFAYRSASTTLETPLADVLARREGVCQDFAHLMIAALRAHGLPARYVSGYLLTDPPPGQARLQGVDASHAWVAAWVPQAGWVEFDPTNGQLADARYITLAWGADFGDVAPLRGVIAGGGQQALTVAVSVTPVREC